MRLFVYSAEEAEQEEIPRFILERVDDEDMHMENVLYEGDDEGELHAVVERALSS